VQIRTGCRAGKESQKEGEAGSLKELARKNFLKKCTIASTIVLPTREEEV